jgi:hypothetical protein
VDPLAPDYPWLTPYQYAGNTPISSIDLDGLENLDVVSKLYCINQVSVTIAVATGTLQVVNLSSQEIEQIPDNLQSNIDVRSRFIFYDKLNKNLSNEGINNTQVECFGSIETKLTYLDQPNWDKLRDDQDILILVDDIEGKNGDDPRAFAYYNKNVIFMEAETFLDADNLGPQCILHERGHNLGLQHFEVAYSKQTEERYGFPADHMLMYETSTHDNSGTRRASEMVVPADQIKQELTSRLGILSTNGTGHMGSPVTRSQVPYLFNNAKNNYNITLDESKKQEFLRRIQD